ncbi:PDDEXK nuclease domain-containing protein [Photobacterium damselae]|uniref:PDDEXK nuclease domain-containing protein n=1 Tax=Photobacterium damselae TaxID=38293 RepID=UPI001F395826|nr:PDDEXK nuclease domain-containing protein [Photobacterium damselae]UKA12661.1 PDDEXK nuclease domain-containing protein [Photobacterium damselae subsp. damselae]
MILTTNPDYQNWLLALKQQVQKSQQKASLAVNTELVTLYWSIGHQIAQKQQAQGWGTKVVEQLAQDLKQAFPSMKGLSRSNLMSMRAFALAWPDFESNSIVQQAVGQIPWGHNVLLIQKLNEYKERLWYAVEVVKNGWSRAVLIHQIESGLILRSGNAVNNFEMTLPQPNSELAVQTLKDPYNFDFLDLNVEAKERDIENALMKHITAFLLELGSGFALVGQQYNLNVGDDDFFIDLLFYHLNLRCYVVIELKADKLTPKDVGQLDFYLAAVDGELKRADDAPTIGLLLCKERNRVVAEYAVRNKTSPIGIAEYKLSEMLPSEIQGQLPSIEDIEATLSSDINQVDKGKL